MMETLILKKSDLSAFLKAIAEKTELYAPLTHKRIGQFEKIKDNFEAAIKELSHYKNTKISIKDFFFKPCEAMFEVKKGEQLTIEEYPIETKPRAFFGVRACDAKALSILDKVFSWDYLDSSYLAARERSSLIGLGCINPCSTCFCTSLEIEPASAVDVDINFIDLGDRYFVEVKTDKGQNLIQDIKLCTNSMEEDKKLAEQKKKESRDKISRFIDAKRSVRILADNFEDPYWEDVARKCIDCGICTFLCPTCHCFDILDEASRAFSRRCRFYDACSFKNFTKMPVENPREERYRRYRQRIRHKYSYYVENFGVIACVGCGRCIEYCPVNLDITRTLNELPEREAVR